MGVTWRHLAHTLFAPVVLVAATAGAAAVSDPFDPAVVPFDATAPLPTTAPPTSLSCSACHVQIAAEWEGSRHRHAGDNAVFRMGFAQEPHVRCAVCHAPEGDEWRRVRVRGPELEHGVGCASCHVRDGAIWSSRPARGYGHEVKVSESLGDERVCTTCHEFFAHRIDDGVVTLLPDVPMQTTTSEWRAWKASSGRSERCQDCHMKRIDGVASHAFHGGGHDVEALRAALAVDIDVDEHGTFAVFASRDVGHRFPTGDIFRRLVVEVDGVEVARFGKVLDTMDNGEHGIVDDTSLVPGVPVRVKLPDTGRRLVVTYHFADDAEEARGRISFEELVVVVHEQALSKRHQRRR